MNASSRLTPRQAAYRDLCSIIAQLSGRSRRAQRALLEAELARALERAHDFERRCAELGVIVASQRDKVLGAGIRIAVAEGAARQRVQRVRQDVFAVVERCRQFDKSCHDFLEVTREVVTVEPPPVVTAPPAPAPETDVDDEAITERVPGASGWPEGAQP
jgi:hypothetical protein